MMNSFEQTRSKYNLLVNKLYSAYIDTTGWLPY